MTARLRRSMLFVPAIRPDRFAKAAATGADIVIVDWEDAVALDRKAEARELARPYFETAGSDGPLRYLRINSPRTTEGLRDLDALFDFARLPDGVFIPKVEAPEEVRWMDEILAPRRDDIELFPAVETAKGVRQASEIALASPRVAVVGFGSVDLAAETGSDQSWDAMLFTRSKVVHAAAEAGVDAMDTVYVDIADSEGLADELRRAKALGFTGKAAIHPSQVAVINAGFSPSAAEVESAQRIVDAAAGDFSGAVQLDGRMIDEPVIVAARRTLALAAQMADHRASGA